MLLHLDPAEGPALVERARQGDADAFGLLVRSHQSQVLALAYAILGEAADAEDAGQESFLRAWCHLDVLADPARFAGWLRRIVFGTCIDRVRAFRSDLLRGDGGALPQLAGGSRTPLERLEHVELTERVLAAIAQLPPRYRTPLTLFHIDGLSHERVAQALGVPTSTVRSLVTRARQKLAVLLRDYAADVLAINPVDDVFQEQDPARPRLLHVLNGDATRAGLEPSGVPGTFAVWADALHEGPVPDVADEPMRELRARFAADFGWVGYEAALALQTEWDRGLAAYPACDEVVFWFEHDLFDQLILIRHLEWFARQDLGDARLALICIGGFPGVDRFIGLGQLTPDQLASLLGTRQPVTHRQTELGRLAWRAFRSEDPTGIERVFERDTSGLPFLAGALLRLLEEYPALDDGLSRTQRQILSVLQEGPLTFGGLFPAAQRMEERPFMGDVTLWLHLHALAAGPRPLVHVEGGPAQGVRLDAVAGITDTGLAVLHGRADHADLNGVNRWIGGVHLQGPHPAWRWDRRARRLHRTGP